MAPGFARLFATVLFPMESQPVRAVAPAWLQKACVTRVLPAVLAVGLATAPAAAWNCPVQIKSAEDAIKKAETMPLTPDARGLIEKAKALVAEAKANHTDAKAKIDHANAMWKARAAQAQAEAAAALALP